VPNVHPIFVHFPIALWPTALLLFALGLLRDEEQLFRMGCMVLYLATASALLALATGFWASQELGHDIPGHDLVHVHRNWMIAATSFGVITTLAAVAVRSQRTRLRPWVVTSLLLVTVVLTILGGDRGARLVFHYGIGTAGESDPGLQSRHPPGPESR